MSMLPVSSSTPSGPDDEEAGAPAVDVQYDRRPNLAEIGIEEHERGVCEDNYENRRLLRRAKMNWDPVYDASGRATGLIAARTMEATKERRILSLAEKRPLMTDPSNRDSEYLTGLDLLMDDDAMAITPPWVIGATRAWQAEQMAGGPSSDKKQPAGLPHRCRMMKSDGIRCMLWASGRIKDDGLCRIHLKTIRKPGADIERAREKIIQSAPYAVDVLEQLMETAESEPVRLKAAESILDRAGVRGGIEIDAQVEITESRPAHVIVAERLARLAEGAKAIEAAAEAARTSEEVEEAEIVADSEETEGGTE
jgi:hypothetical protein